MLGQRSEIVSELQWEPANISDGLILKKDDGTRPGIKRRQCLHQLTSSKEIASGTPGAVFMSGAHASSLVDDIYRCGT